MAEEKTYDALRTPQSDTNEDIVPIKPTTKSGDLPAHKYPAGSQ